MADEGTWTDTIASVLDGSEGHSELSPRVLEDAARFICEEDLVPPPPAGEWRGSLAEARRIVIAVYRLGREFGSRPSVRGRPRHLSELTGVPKLIQEVCDEVRDMLFEKNRKYGNSALDPIRVFSKSPPDEQIKVRMDDKLKRIQNAQDDEDEDVEKDLMGYMVLLRVYRKTNPFDRAQLEEMLDTLTRRADKIREKIAAMPDE